MTEPPQIKIEVCYPNGRYCRTVFAPSKYSAKQLKKHYEQNGMLATIVPPKAPEADQHETHAR